MDRVDIDKRIERMSAAVHEEPGLAELPRDPWQPRWRIDAGWVEFECGCRAERCLKLTQPKPFDPIIFRDLPQQAVYDYVCHRHGPGMNVYVGFGRFKDFAQWKRARRAVLMGRTVA
jgi:hypothetical protein